MHNDRNDQAQMVDTCPGRLKLDPSDGQFSVRANSKTIGSEVG